MEHLYSGSGLLYYHHHLLIGVGSDERPGVHLTDQETFVLLLNLLRLFKGVENLIESWQTQVVSVYLLNILVGSQNNDHEKRVVNKATLSEYLDILFKLRYDFLSLNLCDIEFFEALQEILIFKGWVLILLLLEDGNIKF
jgi:hypothetical protein